MDYVVSLLLEKYLKCTVLLALEDNLFIFICNVNNLHIYMYLVSLCVCIYIERDTNIACPCGGTNILTPKPF